MTTSTKDLKPYTLCWLQTNVGDHYAGLIISADLSNDGSSLQLIIAPMLRIEPSDSKPKWRVIDRKPNYAFTFESCKRTEENPGNSIGFRSALGDVITLSANETDKLVIEELITENS